MVYPVFIFVQQVHQVVDSTFQEWIDISFQFILITAVLVIAVIIEHGPNQVSWLKLTLSEVMLV